MALGRIHFIFKQETHTTPLTLTLYIRNISLEKTKRLLPLHPHLLSFLAKEKRLQLYLKLTWQFQFELISRWISESSVLLRERTCHFNEPLLRLHIYSLNITLYVLHMKITYSFQFCYFMLCFLLLFYFALPCFVCPCLYLFLTIPDLALNQPYPALWLLGHCISLLCRCLHTVLLLLCQFCALLYCFYFTSNCFAIRLLCFALPCLALLLLCYCFLYCVVCYLLSCFAISLQFHILCSIWFAIAFRLL